MDDKPTELTALLLFQNLKLNENAAKVIGQRVIDGNAARIAKRSDHVGCLQIKSLPLLVAAADVLGYLPISALENKDKNSLLFSLVVPAYEVSAHNFRWDGIHEPSMCFKASRGTLLNAESIGALLRGLATAGAEVQSDSTESAIERAAGTTSVMQTCMAS